MWVAGIMGLTSKREDGSRKDYGPQDQSPGDSKWDTPLQQHWFLLEIYDHVHSLLLNQYVFINKWLIDKIYETLQCDCEKKKNGQTLKYIWKLTNSCITQQSK